MGNDDKKLGDGIERLSVEEALARHDAVEKAHEASLLAALSKGYADNSIAIVNGGGELQDPKDKSNPGLLTTPGEDHVVAFTSLKPQETPEEKERKLSTEARKTWNTEWDQWAQRSFLNPSLDRALNEAMVAKGWKPVLDLLDSNKTDNLGSPVRGWVKTGEEWRRFIVAFEKDNVIVALPHAPCGSRSPTSMDHFFYTFSGKEDSLKNKWRVADPAILEKEHGTFGETYVGAYRSAPRTYECYGVKKRGNIEWSPAWKNGTFHRNAQDVGLPSVPAWNDIFGRRFSHRGNPQFLAHKLQQISCTPYPVSDPTFSNYLFFIHEGFVFALPNPTAFPVGRMPLPAFTYADDINQNFMASDGEEVLTTLEAPAVVCPWPLTEDNLFPRNIFEFLVPGKLRRRIIYRE